MHSIYVWEHTWQWHLGEDQMYPEFSWENCFENPCVIQKYIFYHVYTVRSEKYFCKKSKGSYRIRLLFPVRVMPFQIVEGTEPSRLLSSSDLQNKNVKYLRRIKHKKLHNSPQNFNICTLISKCIILETNTSCDGIDLDKISRNWIRLWVLPPSPWRVQF